MVFAVVGGWGVIIVMCSLAVLGAFCTTCSRGVRHMQGMLQHPVALTRGVLCTRLCSKSGIGGCEQKRSCIGFHPSHITVRSTATRVTLLRFVGTNHRRITIPSAIRYSRLVRTCGNTGRSVIATAGAGRRICGFLHSISSHCNVNF